MNVKIALQMPFKQSLIKYGTGKTKVNERNIL